VVTDDRWGIGTTCVHGSYLTCSDRFHPSSLQTRKWENAMTLDRYSWGFRRDATISDYLTINELIYTLVTTVAYGGNLLVNIGPSHDGTITPIMAERLLQMGTWLHTNGEAIYDSRPWRVQNDTANTVFYTTIPSTGAVYAMFTAWPANNVVVLTAPKVMPRSRRCH
jgi:alpha-L-fucosidase